MTSETPPSYQGPDLNANPLPEKEDVHLTSDPEQGLLSPWLGLRARLLLSPISVALVSLIFVATRLILSSADVTDSVSSAKARFLAICTEAESAASLAASLPHFLATSTNADLSKSITASVQGAGKLTLLGLTAIEELLSYFVDSYKSLFLCFMELLVRGSLAVVIAAVDAASDAVKAAAETIRVAIQESIQGVNSIITSAVSGVNDIIGVFGQSVTAPSISVPSLTALQNISLPTVIQDSLISINASLPTLNELKDKIDNLVQTPFETVRLEVNSTISSFTFNSTMLTVPSMQTVAFCDKVDTSSLDNMQRDLRKASYIGLGMLVLLAIVLMLLCVAKEWYSWRSGIRHVENTQKAWLLHCGNPVEKNGVATPDGSLLETRNLTMLLEIAKRPLISAFAQQMCHKLNIRSERAKARVSWYLCLISYPAAVACLVAGVVGLLSVYGQIFAIHRISAHYNSELSSSLSNLSSSVVDLVNTQMRNASVEFATTTNAVILGIEDDLNTHLFSWVSVATTTMNDTLNEFLNGITDTLTSTFGSTPFQAPLQTFVDCVVGQKVKGIGKALTWIHDNAHVNFTTVPTDVFMLSDQAQSQLVKPVQDIMLGNSTAEGGNSGLVGTVVDKYLTHLRKELTMFWALVGIYAAVMLVGLLVVLFASIYDKRNKPNNSYGSRIDRSRPRMHMKRSSYGRVSPFISTPKLKPMLLDDRASSRKADISYPLQVVKRHDTLISPPSSPAQHRRDALESNRSSWLSFLVKASTTTEKEAPDARFERLFGCSPVSSPTSTRFPSRRASEPIETIDDAAVPATSLRRAPSIHRSSTQASYPQAYFASSVCHAL